jgi:hypothetical protein
MSTDRDGRAAEEQLRYRREVMKVVPESIYDGWILREASEVFIRILHEIRLNVQRPTGAG